MKTIAVTLLLALAGAAEGQVARREAPPEKVVPEVRAALSTGEPQEVIVVFDDFEIERAAANMRRTAGLSMNNAFIQTFKSSEFAELKTRALTGLAGADATVLENYEHLPMSHLRLSSDAALDALVAQDDVLAVYPNEIRYMQLTESLALINQPAVDAAGHKGLGTTVAVLDTGVDYTNAAFGSCTAPGVPSGCRVVFAQDFAPDDGSPDEHGHGTNVAGIVAGVAGQTSIAALDVFDGGGAPDSAILGAINWSITNQAVYNIVAMNLSLGGGFSATECPVSVYTVPFDNARQAGILPVVASGNDAVTNGMAHPACVPGAFRVGAVYDTTLGTINWSNCTDVSPVADLVTCFSNSADFLHILAPGALIQAAGILQGGTSQATPHVAGATAVLKGAVPSLSPTNVENSMMGTGVAILDSRNGLTFPRLNLQTAVNLALANSAPDQPSNPSPTSAAVGVGLETDLSWTGGDPDAGDTVTYDVYFGQSADPPLVSSDQAATTYDPGSLLPTSSYYWKIVARDNNGFETESPIWSFNTAITSGCANALVDGGLELGTPNSAWTEASTNFGTPLCSVARCGAGSVPRTGSWHVWFGGIAAAEASSVEQAVTIAPGTATLSFYLWVRSSSGNGQDYVRALVDGNIVFASLEGNSTYTSGYQKVSVDVSAFADGGAHTVRLETLLVGTATSSFFVDDVELNVCAPPTATDEVAVDFAGQGLWHYDSAFTQLAAWDPDVVEPWDDKLAAAFGAGRGLWLHEQGSFNQLTPWSAYDLEPFGSRLAAAFDGGRGLYIYDSGFVQATPWEPTMMAGWGSDLAVAFGANRGLWVYDGTEALWTQIAGWDPYDMVVWDNKLVVAFPLGRGIWMHDGVSWTQLTNWQPTQLLGDGTNLLAGFDGGRGLWSYDGSWSQIAGWEPYDLEMWGTKILAAFDSGRGLYSYDGSWTQLTNWEPTHMRSHGSAFTVDFGTGKGVYRYETGFVQLTPWTSEGIDAVNLNP